MSYTQNNLTTTALSEQYIGMLSPEKGKFSTPRSNTLPDEIVKKIIEEASKELKLDINQTEAAICMLMQQGGSALCTLSA